MKSKKRAGRPKGETDWQKIGVSFPADILAAVDAARNGQTRSAWLVQAARDALGPVAVGRASGPTPGQAPLPGVAECSGGGPKLGKWRLPAAPEPEAKALAEYSARVGGRLAE